MLTAEKTGYMLCRLAAWKTNFRIQPQNSYICRRYCLWESFKPQKQSFLFFPILQTLERIGMFLLELLTKNELYYILAMTRVMLGWYRHVDRNNSFLFIPCALYIIRCKGWKKALKQLYTTNVVVIILLICYFRIQKIAVPLQRQSEQTAWWLSEEHQNVLKREHQSGFLGDRFI